MTSFMMALIALLDKVLDAVRAASVDWPSTTRFCFIIGVVATTTCLSAAVLRIHS